MLEWAGLGAIVFALFIFCARIMRRGLPTLDDDRKRHLDHIAEAKRRLSEDSRNISAQEQMKILESAIRDLLRLEGLDASASLAVQGHTAELRLAQGTFNAQLLMKELNLKSAHRELHGVSRWRLEAGGIIEEHRDLCSLMGSLAAHVRHGAASVRAPEHIARRVANTRRMRERLGSGYND